MFDMAAKLKGIRLDVAEYRRPDPACATASSSARSTRAENSANDSTGDGAPLTHAPSAASRCAWNSRGSVVGVTVSPASARWSYSSHPASTS